MSETLTRSTRVSLSRGDSPVVYAQRLYTQFLQGLFNFCPAGCMHWEPDIEKSEIVIRAEAPLNLQVTGKRPAITIVVGPMQGQGLGIGQLVRANLNTGVRLYSDLVSGHFVVYCLAESDIIARWIASIVQRGTQANQRLLECPGGFHQIGRPSMSENPPSPPGSLVVGDAKGLVMVQVNIPFTFQWAWETTPRASESSRSLDMITQERRASDYPYPSLRTLERVELAMSTTPVLVRRIGTSISLDTIHDGIQGFQAVVADSSSDEA